MLVNTGAQIEISPDGQRLALQIAGLSLNLNALWLRDNAELARNPLAQKRVTILDVPANSTVQSASVNDTTLRVILQPDSLIVEYPYAWLLEHAPLESSSDEHSRPERVNSALTLWDSTLAEALPSADYETIRHNEAALAQWLQSIAQFGFARLTGLQGYSEELLEVVSLFGYVRDTNYGPYFDVRTEIDPANLAYSNLALQPHTDNPYRHPVPTLQMLCCLENSTNGGESIVVDGFQAAVLLEQQNPSHFELLSRFNARFRYRADGKVDLCAQKPLVQLDAQGELTGIHFNNRSMAPIQDVPSDLMIEYYAAYRHLATIIASEQLGATFRLQPGELFIVDNTRVLHGRTGYTSTGNRWLQGCYPDKDGLLSTLAMLRARSPSVC